MGICAHVNNARERSCVRDCIIKIVAKKFRVCWFSVSLIFFFSMLGYYAKSVKMSDWYSEWNIEMNFVIKLSSLQLPSCMKNVFLSLHFIRLQTFRKFFLGWLFFYFDLKGNVIIDQGPLRSRRVLRVRSIKIA